MDTVIASQSRHEHDAEVVTAWLRCATERLAVHHAHINAANVFPVADHDTGTNLLVTLRSGLEALEKAQGSALHSAAQVAAHALQGMIHGARGNSGAIVSQFWRAVSETLSNHQLDAEGYAEILDRSVVLIEQALATPVEGTAWSVLRSSAQSARELVQQGAQQLEEIVGAVTQAAVTALALTPSQLPQLARAKVVDAGGLGIVCILDALTEAYEEFHTSTMPTTENRYSSAGEVLFAPYPAPALEGVSKDAESFVEKDTLSAARSHPHQSRDLVSYHEVEMEIRGMDTAAQLRLRATLSALGDSLVIGGDGVRSTVHVHTQDAGSAVLAGLEAGQIVTLRITNLPSPEGERSRAVLSLSAGAGVAELFQEAGAQIVNFAAGMSIDDLANAVLAVGADEVFVLPNGALEQPEIIRVASAIRLRGQAVRFLPSSSLVQGLAAIAVHDPDRPVEDDEYAMAVAAAGARWARMVTAQGEAFTWAGKCAAGDVLGMVGEEVVLVSQDRCHAGADLIDLLLASGGELVTVVVGQEGDHVVAQDMAEHVRKRYPGIELVIFQGGQPGEIVQVGVE